MRRPADYEEELEESGEDLYSEGSLESAVIVTVSIGVCVLIVIACVIFNH